MSEQRKKSELAHRARVMKEIEAEEAKLAARKRDYVNSWSPDDFKELDELKAEGEARQRKADEDALRQLAERACLDFLLAHPEYPANPHTSALVFRFLKDRNLAPTHANIELAFTSLVEGGQIVPDFSNRNKQAREALIDSYRAAGHNLPQSKAAAEMSQIELQEATESQGALDDAIQRLYSQLNASTFDSFEAAGREVDAQRRKDGRKFSI